MQFTAELEVRSKITGDELTILLRIIAATEKRAVNEITYLFQENFAPYFELLGFNIHKEH